MGWVLLYLLGWIAFSAVFSLAVTGVLAFAWPDALAFWDSVLGILSSAFGAWVLLALRFRRNFRRRFRVWGRRAGLTWGWAGMALLLMLGYLLLRLALGDWLISILPEHLGQAWLDLYHERIDDRTWLLNLLLGVGVAPLIEELVFRAWFQPALAQRQGPVLAWLWISLLFGLIHGHPLLILNSFLLGLLFGGLAWKSGFWGVAWLAHALNNILALVFSPPRLVWVADLNLTRTDFWASLVGGLLVLAGGLLWWAWDPQFRRPLTKPGRENRLTLS